MRWHTLAPLLVATGCNWLYGLDKTIAIDGSISELPPASRTRLVWAIATTDGMPVPPGIDPVLVYKPIGSDVARPEPPMIQVGADGPLTDAVYDMQDGSFEIPYELRESPHRIVYTLPGESVPHEVQWALTGAILVVPRTTRLDAAPVPAASGYTITPAGLIGQFAAPAIYTSGVFTYSAAEQPVDGTATLQFAANAKPIAGPSGAPQPGKGDWIMVGDFTSRSPQQSSLRGWALTKVDLQPNMMSVPSPQPMWVMPSADRTLTTVACTTNPTECNPAVPGEPDKRLLNVFPTGGVDASFLTYGVSPSTDLPGFLPGVAPTYIDRPLILPFLESTRFDASLVLADPSPELGLDRVLHARRSLTRTVNGVSLTSSVQGITNRFEPNGMRLAAPLATNVTLGTTSLSGDTDAVPMPASSDIQRLRFVPEAGFNADDYVITLYEITGTSLAPVRVYHVIQPDVKINASHLVPGRHYVFGITARTGFPGAATGDYGKALYPFSASTTFARTFIVQ